jgi:polyisoprenyl-phosphate glycosyltransferase
MKKLVTIVYPVLNEADGAAHLAERMANLVKLNAEYDIEFVVIDDGSTDSTTSILQSAVDSNINLRVVTLARNFGSHAALSAGLDAAKGECAILLGADLQEPESLVSDFLASWSAGNEVVWGVRHQRKVSGITSKLASVLFSRLFTKYADLENYPPEGPSGVLCDRAVIDVVAELNERNRNLYGLIAWVGFKQTKVYFEQSERKAGQSKWTTRKLIKLALDSLVQFSSAPIRLMTYIGMFFASLGFFYAALLITRALFIQRGPAGWTSVIVAVLVIGGVQLLMLGLLGEYLWRGVDETRQRSLYIIDKRKSPGYDRETHSGTRTHT